MVLTGGLHWFPNDSMSLGLLSVFKSISVAKLVWMVSILPQISSYFYLFFQILCDCSNGSMLCVWVTFIFHLKRSHHGIVINRLDCNIIVSKFKLQSHYYVHFRTNTVRKGMKPFISLAMGWIIPLLFFYKDGFGIE